MSRIDTSRLVQIAKHYGAPVWIYNAEIIKERIEQLRAFDVIRYAQKANSNTHILRLMKSQGVNVDSVSLGELERAQRAGFQLDGTVSHEVVFTADLLDRSTLQRVVQDKVTVNAGSIDMLRQLGELSPGHRVWLRVNPGFGHGHSNKTNTGGENSKHGIWYEHMAEAMSVVEQYGLKLVGLHMHIGSGVDYGHLQQVCGAMVTLVKTLGCDLEAVSAGGGLSIPYRQGDTRIDTDHYFTLWDAARKEIEAFLGHAVTLEIEPGRFLVAESGLLMAEVRAVKPMGNNHFALVDAGFNDLMRPSMYGSYHHISAITAAPAEDVPTIVAGPLCESGDVFTQRDGGVVESRILPRVSVGDWLVFHDAGAYGASMSSNYNTRPLIAEVLVDGETDQLIRRRQTVQELLVLEEV